MQTIAAVLLKKLEQILGVFDQLIDASSILYDPDKVARMSEQYNVAIVAIVPDSSWGPSDEQQRALQRQLLEQWNPWIAQLKLLISSDTVKRKGSVEGAAKKVRAWIERDCSDMSIPSNIAAAHDTIRRHMEPLFGILRELDNGCGPLVVVPDTNVLLRSPDVTKYRDVVASDAYTVVLVPGVLAEIDEHKVNHRNESVRERARKISARIKGWHAQGGLATGVKVEGKVLVRVEGREPKLSESLPWLDGGVVDDRIIASILELQRRDPAARVVLLTGDAVMLAKADASSIPTGDTPDPEV